ncbi:MAG: response regulator [Candidatus Alcyoniella australis]|nr:response regulator [Candidatus Alcyoniella australis]
MIPEKESRPVLLVIDDEVEFLETAQMFFRRRGFEVLVADCEKTVFEIVAQQSISYILVDYFLGDVDGLSLVTGLRDRVKKVALLTGYASSDVAAQARDLGFHVFRKPANLDSISTYFLAE